MPLSLQPHGPRHVITRIEAFVVFISAAATLSIMVLPPLLNGLYILVRDVFGALLLPFVLLFRLGGGAGNDSVSLKMDGSLQVGTLFLHHPVTEALSAFCIIYGTAAFFLARRDEHHPIARISGIVFSVAGLVLASWPTLLLMIPNCVIQIGEAIYTFKKEKTSSHS